MADRTSLVPVRGTRRIARTVSDPPVQASIVNIRASPTPAASGSAAEASGAASPKGTGSLAETRTAARRESSTASAFAPSGKPTRRPSPANLNVMIQTGPSASDAQSPSGSVTPLGMQTNTLTHTRRSVSQLVESDKRSLSDFLPPPHASRSKSVMTVESADMPGALPLNAYPVLIGHPAKRSVSEGPAGGTSLRSEPVEGSPTAPVDPPATDLSPTPAGKSSLLPVPEGSRTRSRSVAEGSFQTGGPKGGYLRKSSITPTPIVIPSYSPENDLNSWASGKSPGVSPTPGGFARTPGGVGPVQPPQSTPPHMAKVVARRYGSQTPPVSDTGSPSTGQPVVMSIIAEKGSHITPVAVRAASGTGLESQRDKQPQQSPRQEQSPPPVELSPQRSVPDSPEAIPFAVRQDSFVLTSEVMKRDREAVINRMVLVRETNTNEVAVKRSAQSMAMLRRSFSSGRLANRNELVQITSQIREDNLVVDVDAICEGDTEVDHLREYMSQFHDTKNVTMRDTILMKYGSDNTRHSRYKDMETDELFDELQRRNNTIGLSGATSSSTLPVLVTRSVSGGAASEDRSPTGKRQSSSEAKTVENTPRNGGVTSFNPRNRSPTRGVQVVSRELAINRSALSSSSAAALDKAATDLVGMLSTRVVVKCDAPTPDRDDDFDRNIDEIRQLMSVNSNPKGKKQQAPSGRRSSLAAGGTSSGIPEES